MRYIRFDHQGRIGYGILEHDQVVVLRSNPLLSTREGSGGENGPSGERLDIGDVRLLPPVIPRTFYAAGINYPRHVRSQAEMHGVPFQLPTRSDIGYRAINALIGPDEAIVIPPDSSGRVQFEAELVVVIGKEAKHLEEPEALSCVFGYTIGNDISERTWQKSDRTLWRAKNTDTFKPMGPWIETDVDLDALVTKVRLNGEEVSRFHTNDMILGVASTLSTITKYVTLYPGDVVWMGTDDPTLDMVAGDTVEVEISGLGVLRNPVT